MSAAGTRLIDAETGEVIVERLEVAGNPWSRFMGLMGRPSIDRDTGLLLEPCNQIHMFFMRFAIDVLFLDRQGGVKRVMHNLRPWHISPLVFGARSTIELPAGSLAGRSMEGRRLRVE